MELKKGFRKTEAGIIPDDWQVEILENLTDRIGDGIHTTPKYSDSGEFYFVNGNNLAEGRIKIIEDTKQVKAEDAIQHLRNLNCTSVLISINGTIGNVAYYDNEKIILGKSAAYINPNGKLSRDYLYHYLQTETVYKYFENELTGSTIKNLGLAAIRNTPIPLPPTKTEQTAIATALSDMDNLIAGLEKLIEKKKAIKQGAMQELLRPKEGWVVKRLGELSINISSGKSLTNSNSGQYPIYGSTGIIGWNNSYDYQGEKILVARVGANAGTLNKVDGKYCVSDNTLMISLMSNIDFDFICLVLMKFNLNKLVYGSGQPLITGGQLKEISIKYPNGLEKQKEISGLIMDIQKDIEINESFLVKNKMLKQGMMQELLTGKTRLV